MTTQYLNDIIGDTGYDGEHFYADLSTDLKTGHQMNLPGIFIVELIIIDGWYKILGEDCEQVREFKENVDNDMMVLSFVPVFKDVKAYLEMKRLEMMDEFGVRLKNIKEQSRKWLT